MNQAIIAVLYREILVLVLLVLSSRNAQSRLSRLENLPLWTQQRHDVLPENHAKD